MGRVVIDRRPSVAGLLLALGLTVDGSDRRDWYFTKLKHCGGVDWEIADYHASRWMVARLPPKAVVGAADSGVYSFFTTSPSSTWTGW